MLGLATWQAGPAQGQLARGGCRAGTQSCVLRSWDASSTRCERGLRNPSPARAGFSGTLRCWNLRMKPSSSSLSHLTPRDVPVGEHPPSPGTLALTSFSTSSLHPLVGREPPSLLTPSTCDKRHMGFPSSRALGEHHPSLLGHKYKNNECISLRHRRAAAASSPDLPGASLGGGKTLPRTNSTSHPMPGSP